MSETPLAGGRLTKLASMCKSTNGGIPQSGLIYEWPFEESSGDRLDTKAGKALAPSASVTRAAGKVGYAVDMSDPYSDAQRLSASWTWASNDVSISVWVRADGLGTGSAGQNYIFARDSGGAGGLWLLYWGNAEKNKFSCYAINSASGAADWPSSPTTGQWYHICAGYDHSQLKTWISVDGGVRVYGGAISNAQSSSNLTTNVGNVPGGPYAWDGQIDQLRIYDRALTDGDIAALYNSGNGI